jgi:exosortase
MKNLFSDEAKSRYAAEFKRIFSKDNDQLWPVVLILGLTVALIGCYGNGLWDVTQTWKTDQYSHAWMVPIFSLVVLVMWRRPIGRVKHWERWAGVGLFCAGIILRATSAKLSIATLDYMSFVPALAGIVMMVGGLSTMKWAWAPLAFLLFMFPLSMKAEQLTAGVLQKTFATPISTYTLQTLGISCYYEGFVINMDGLSHPLNVAEQCSGLRMLTILVAMAVGFVMVVKLQWWEKVVLVVFSIPIAVAVNVLRIVITAILYRIAEAEYVPWITSETAKVFMHDGSGYLMPPMALGLLYLVWVVLSKLFITVEPVRAPVAVRPRVRPAVASKT